MRKKSLFLAVVTALFMGNVVKAQETSLETSTAAAPVWYNLNSAATAVGATNAGLAQVTSSSNFGEIIKGTLPPSGSVTSPEQNKDKYLWRFENDGSGNVYIINKSSGMKISNPPTAVSGTAERFRMNETGSTYSYLSVSGISTAGVSGTAFYFTPTNATYSAVGRINCDGGVAELVLFKGGTNGDILQTGGKGSLFWLRKVLMKSVSVAVSSASTGAGAVVVMKDDGTTPEAAQLVSKAQTIGVTVVATPASGSAFAEWRNAANGTVVSTSATYVYSGTENIQLEAVFSPVTAVKSVQASEGVYPNPFTTSLTVQGSKVSMFDLNGKKVLSSSQATFNTANLKKGTYILKYNTAEGSKTVKVVKE